MWFKNSLFLILFFSICLLSQFAAAQHCSVKELFLKMPDYMVENLDAETRKNYLSKTDTTHFIVDEKNGYLLFDIPDSPFEDFELAVFKKKDGTCIVAYSYSGDRDMGDDDDYFIKKECFNLYEFKNNKWKKITQQLIQWPVTRNYFYKLPREGRDIILEAYSKNSSKGKSNIKYHHTLRWTGEKFIKLK